MFEQFDKQSHARIVHDPDGVARIVFHADRYKATKARTPRHAACDYLKRYGHLLDVPARHLKDPFRAFAHAPVAAAAIEYRHLCDKRHFDVTTVAFQQTYFGLPIWEAGLSVTVKHDPLRVVGARSTAHRELEATRPQPKHVAAAKTIDAKTLARALGLSGAGGRHVPLRITDRRLMVYQYDEVRRRHATTRQRGRAAGAPTLPLPPVHPSIEHDQHYVVSAVHFSLDFPDAPPLNWVALIEIENLSVLLLRPFVDNVTGFVFQTDPVTLAGGPHARAGNAKLNPRRSRVELAGLAAPARGAQHLKGAYVTLTDLLTPYIKPPIRPAGKNFDYSARTNNFAAVNAYHNCDRVFRLVEELGFRISDYFPGTKFPSRVDHRGHYDKNHPQGNEINAHCAGNAAGTGIGYTTFSLADTRNLKQPIGIACDFRIVLHELLGHGILYNHIGTPRFKFAHSAGDSFAAILNDPGSKAPDRFATFPWLSGIPESEQRFHNRRVTEGFGWNGTIARHAFDPELDPGGYNNEQILSSTMFRFYRAIGGDADDVATQRFAAHMTCHILLAAVQTFTAATSPTDASHLAAALIKADLTDWPAKGISGGAYHKVIRWAFEKQGLYQATAMQRPNRKAGVPPPVDVYLEDGRRGEYTFKPDYWSCEAIWNRRRSDGGTSHQRPVAGIANYAYVKIKNRGAIAASKVTVRAFQARHSQSLAYPADWRPMKTARLTAPRVPPNSSREVIVGPFAWVPPSAEACAMLMVASASRDPSNVDNFTARDSIPNWRLVPHDNNIGQRNVTVAERPDADKPRTKRAGKRKLRNRGPRH